MKLQTFIICADPDNPALEERIREKFGEETYVVRPRSQWLVAADKTTHQVYDHLEIEEQKESGVVIFLVSNYWGRHNKDMWEWLELD